MEILHPKLLQYDTTPNFYKEAKSNHQLQKSFKEAVVGHLSQVGGLNQQLRGAQTKRKCKNNCAKKGVCDHMKKLQRDGTKEAVGKTSAVS